MKQKGLVEEVNKDTEPIWKLTEKGKETSLETKIHELGATVDESTLSEAGVTVSNIVGSFDIGRRIDLNALAEDLSNTEYHPERYNSVLYRPKKESSTTIIIPASGHISITGSTSKEELFTSANLFLESLHKLGIETDVSLDCLAIQNIVADFDFKREFDLNALSIGLGLEQTEYEPEQFPGIIYRSTQNATVLIFNSGKCVITGAKSYSELFSVLKEVTKEFDDIGVDLPTSSVDSVLDP